MAAFIASQREQHGVPQAVSCRALGVSQAWFYKWKGGAAAAGCAAAAAESRGRAAVRGARGQGRGAADRRRAA